MRAEDAYQPDRTLKGKIRRRVVRLAHRRPLTTAPDRPMVSFTFDDAPISAAETGAQLLEARGARGVFYVSAGLCGQEGPMGPYAQVTDYVALARRGHEIACHTFSHLDCGRATGAAARADVDQNLANPTPAVGIEGPDGEAIAQSWIDEAVRRRAWLILYTHDVREAPSPWGCTPDALARLIDHTLGADAQIVTAAQAAEQLGVAAAA